MSNEHNWIPEHVKTWIVVITMTILVGGMGWLYYAMHQHQAERAEQPIIQEQKEDG